MTEYGITWSGTRHVVGHRNGHGIPFAACNAAITLYVEADEPSHPLKVRRMDWAAAPMCKRCAKFDGAATGFSEGIPKEREQ